MLEKLLLEWLREWPCEDMPASPRRAEKKIKRPSHHGTEEVTSEVGNNLKARIGLIFRVALCRDGQPRCNVCVSKRFV